MASPEPQKPLPILRFNTIEVQKKRRYRAGAVYKKELRYRRSLAINLFYLSLNFFQLSPKKHGGSSD